VDAGGDGIVNRSDVALRNLPARVEQRASTSIPIKRIMIEIR